MLPDYPRFKKHLQDLLLIRFQRRVSRRMGPLAKSPEMVLHEGADSRLVRADETTHTLTLQEIQVSMSITFEEAETMSVEALLTKVDAWADEFGEKQAEIFLRRIQEDLEQAGQTVDAKGKPFVQAFFEMLSTIEMDFDSSGRPQWPTPIAGEKAARAFSQLSDEIAEDPVLQKKLAKIIDQKRFEWHDRELNRKLVG